MGSPVIYLNELSCLFEGLSLDAMRPHVDSAIAAVQAAVRIRNDTTVSLDRPLSQLTLGEGCYTFGAVLPGPNNRVSVFKRMLDRAPFGPVYQLDCEVCFGGSVGVGLTWADHKRSFVLSMGHTAHWANHTIAAQRRTIDDLGNLNTTPVEIANLAVPQHAQAWRTRIEEYGMEPARSSLLYRGNQFVIRMHLDDHEPPHIHVYPHADQTTKFLAKVRIDNGDVLEGQLSSSVRNEVFEVLATYRPAFMEGWHRCRRGQLPVQLA